MSEEKTNPEIKIEIIPLCGPYQQIYFELIKIRQSRKILEEIISTQAFQPETPKLIGMTAQPTLGILMVGIVVCEAIQK